MLALLSVVIALVAVGVISYASRENYEVEMVDDKFHKGAMAAELKFHRAYEHAKSDKEEYLKQSQLAQKDSMLEQSFKQASEKLSRSAAKVHEDTESESLKLRKDREEISREMQRLNVEQSALALARGQVKREEEMKKIIDKSIPRVQTGLKLVDRRFEDLQRAKGLIEKELKKGIKEDRAAQILAGKSRVELDRYQQQAVHARQEMNNANTKRAILLAKAKVASKKARLLKGMASNVQGKESKEEIESLANRYELEASSLKQKASESRKAASLWDAKAKESLTYLTMLMNHAKSAASYVEDVRGLGGKMMIEHAEEKQLTHQKSLLMHRLRDEKAEGEKIQKQLLLSEKALQIGETTTKGNEEKLKAAEENFAAERREEMEKDKHARKYLQKAWLDDRQARDLGAAAKMHNHAASELSRASKEEATEGKALLQEARKLLKFSKYARRVKQEHEELKMLTRGGERAPLLSA